MALSLLIIPVTLKNMDIGDIFSAFHWLTVIAVVALIVFGVIVAFVLAQVFKRDFDQD